MARSKELTDVEAEAKEQVEAAKEEAKALVEAAKAEEAAAREAAKEAKAEEKEAEKAARAIEQGKTVKVRNRGTRGLALINTEGRSLFVGPKATVEVSGDLVSESIKQQAELGLIALEG